MHKELGFGPKFVDEGMRVSYPTLPNLAIRRRSQLELLAEEMRVLYVALTRPKEKMILVGTVKDLPKRCPLGLRPILTRSCFCRITSLPGTELPGLIGPAVIRHPSAGRSADRRDCRKRRARVR